MKVKLMYIVLFLTSLIPIKLLYILSNILQIINRYTIKYRFNITKQNLKLAFPKLNQKKSKKLINEFYNHFFNIVVEMVKSINFKKKEIFNRVNIKNISAIEKVIKNKKHIVLIGSHYGNWEWVLLRIGLIKNINLSAVYKPLSNTIFDEIVFKMRTRFSAELVPLKKWKYHILNKKMQPHTFLFISDQVPENKKNGIRVKFLNQSTLFYQGAEKTARLLEAEVFYIDLETIKKGYYNIEFKKIKSKNITIEYTNLLEKTINKNPVAWLWSHNRWKR